MSDDKFDDEELQDAIGDDEPDNRFDTPPKSVSEKPSLDSALVDAYRGLDDGDFPKNLSLWDGNLAVILRALQEADELDSVIDAAADQLDRDVDETNRDSRGEALRLLIRVGLAETNPELLERAAYARDEYRRQNTDPI